MKFPYKFEIDIRNKEELAILWACFNISTYTVAESLRTGYSKMIKDMSKKLVAMELSLELSYKTDIWNRLERMVNEIK